MKLKSGSKEGNVILMIGKEKCGAAQIGENGIQKKLRTFCILTTCDCGSSRLRKVMNYYSVISRPAIFR